MPAGGGNSADGAGADGGEGSMHLREGGGGGPGLDGPGIGGPAGGGDEKSEELMQLLAQFDGLANGEKEEGGNEALITWYSSLTIDMQSQLDKALDPSEKEKLSRNFFHAHRSKAKKEAPRAPAPAYAPPAFAPPPARAPPSFSVLGDSAPPREAEAPPHDDATDDLEKELAQVRLTRISAHLGASRRGAH